MNDTKNSNSSAVHAFDKCRVEYTVEGPHVLIGPIKVLAGDMKITLKGKAAKYLLLIEDAAVRDATITEIVDICTKAADQKYKDGEIITKEPDLFTMTDDNLTKIKIWTGR